MIKTNKCRKPCEKHKAINPATGRCVTKSYLKCIQRETCGELDHVYIDQMNKNDKNSERDMEQGLVPHVECYPRKLNIHTGYCKTPCKDGYAMNPATGGCVTLKYLKCLNAEDYDTDDDDDMIKDVIFTPTGLVTKSEMVLLPSFKDFIGTIPTISDIKTLFDTSSLTISDTAVMRGIFETSIKSQTMLLSGTYDRNDRKETCVSGKSSSHSDCGIKNISTEVSRSIVSATLSDSSLFTWSVHHGTGFDMNLVKIAVEMSKTGHVRLLVLTSEGLWRVLIPHMKSVSSIQSLEDYITTVTPKLEKIDNNSRTVAADIAQIGFNDIHISFAQYDK